ncbi:MAG: cytochrome c-type biogenesis protein CcmH [Anaerolinea sp.]|nr:cytochrome c-type biogenesis protein CcmH [Anaerolinea sp.]
MTRFVKLALLLVMLIGVVGAASAQEVAPTPVRQVTDDEVNAIAEKLYCPVCENITLDTCGTAACADWRYEIRLQLESGMTEQQIVEDFVRRFGDRVVGTPLDPTLRTLSLVTPWIVVAGVLIAAAAVLASRRRGETQAVVNPSKSAYVDQFEQDLGN